MQDTPFSWLAPALRVGGGLGRPGGAVPSLGPVTPLEESTLPTAVHALAEVHDTPFRLVTSGPVLIVQLVPFHCSPSMTTLPEAAK